MPTEQVLEVVHDNSCEYGGRVSVAHHMACLKPRELPWQRRFSHRLEIEPTPSWQTEILDSQYNHRQLFSHHTAHTLLRVRAVSRVCVASRLASWRLDLSPEWTQVREQMRYRAGAPHVPQSEYIFASHFVPLHVELAEYARADFPAGQPLMAGAQALMRRIYHDFTYVAGSTEISTPVLEAFYMRRGVCQDFAHVMIGALRALGLPARYVSGYLLTGETPDAFALEALAGNAAGDVAGPGIGTGVVVARPAPGLVGADASHAWVSVWCPVNGWVDFDPTNAILADAGHVTLALGRDYGDVAPLRGIIRGVGAHAMRVAVTVAAINGDSLEQGAPAG